MSPDDFRCIVIDLAAADAHASGWCPLCERCVEPADEHGLADHDPRCPWRRAVELLAVPEGSPRWTTETLHASVTEALDGEEP